MNLKKLVRKNSIKNLILVHPVSTPIGFGFGFGFANAFNLDRTNFNAYFDFYN